MAVVAINFSKINIERKESISGKIDIKNNIAIKDVSSMNLNVAAAAQKGLKFDFEFTTKYEPDFANITFNGYVLFMADEKTVNAAVEGWKKDKKVDTAIMQPVLNAALNKCNIKALITAEDLGLPPPVPLPKIGVAEEKAKKKK